MKCLQCQSNTNNAKFCSSSCSATHNNSKREPKVSVKYCKSCEKPFSVKWDKRARLNCDQCVKARSYIKDKFDLNQQRTVGEFKNEHSNAHSRPWTDRIRGMARGQHSKHKHPCVCGYSLHVEVCHKEAITDFPDSSTVAEINHPDNIIFLCRNCHWEFDHGHLQLS